jgi:hypothetical protein
MLSCCCQIESDERIASLEPVEGDRQGKCEPLSVGAAEVRRALACEVSCSHGLSLRKARRWRCRRHGRAWLLLLLLYRLELCAADSLVERQRFMMQLCAK